MGRTYSRSIGDKKFVRSVSATVRTIVIGLLITMLQKCLFFSIGKTYIVKAYYLNENEYNFPFACKDICAILQPNHTHVTISLHKWIIS